MRLSRNFSVDDWKKLKFSSEEEWQTAVTILQDRFETRYLEHIRVLLDRPTSGFVVLALDSALMETLEQFRRGVPKTPSGQVKTFFISFLTETVFSEHFNEELAELFYHTIRCGLLHQTEAGETSRVKHGGHYALVAASSDHRGVVVNTSAFHALLETYIGGYLSKLRDADVGELRINFRKKMRYICRMEEKEAEEPIAA